MLVMGGLILGAMIGARIALQRGGNKKDALQYAAGFGIAFMLAGLFATIFMERMLAG